MSDSLWDPSESHLLSRKAKDECWDTFIFREVLMGGGNLVIGFNVSRHGSSLSTAIFLRWLSIITSTSYDPNPHIRLYPCKVETIGVLQHMPELPGNLVHPNHIECMKPGNYMIEDCDHGPKGQHTNKGWAELTIIWQEDDDMPPPPVLSPASHCRITGLNMNLRAIAVVPAIYPAYFKYGGGIRMKKEMSLHLNADNVITLHEDLVDAFEENRFSVDVDDRYRIVILRDIPPHSKALGLLQNIKHLPRPESNHSDFDKYLRYHFKLSLEVHSSGGDVMQDYSMEQIQDAMTMIEDDNSGFLAQELTPLKVAVEMDYVKMMLQDRIEDEEDHADDDDMDNEQSAV